MHSFVGSSTLSRAKSQISSFLSDMTYLQFTIVTLTKLQFMNSSLRNLKTFSPALALAVTPINCLLLLHKLLPSTPQSLSSQTNQFAYSRFFSIGRKSQLYFGSCAVLNCAKRVCERYHCVTFELIGLWLSIDYSRVRSSKQLLGPPRL